MTSVYEASNGRQATAIASFIPRAGDANKLQQTRERYSTQLRRSSHPCELSRFIMDHTRQSSFRRENSRRSDVNAKLSKFSSRSIDFVVDP